MTGVGKALRALGARARRVRIWWARWGRDLTTFIAVGLAAWAVVGTQNQVDDLKAETSQRIDETCRISEAKQKNDSEALASTYAYLAGLRPREFGQPLNRAILAGLPRTIREATTDDAPPFCDQPGIGLPEPDPPRPCRAGMLSKRCIERPRNLPPG